MKQINKAPSITLSVEHLVSCEDAQIALVQGDDQRLKKQAWARGHELSSRENWLDFGTLVACKIHRNSDGNEFCEITNAAGETSSMKLKPKTNQYGTVIGKNNWELAYHLSDTLTEYKLAKADLHILISAHGNWSTKNYFDLVQVIV